jgi:hypothetical protein
MKPLKNSVRINEPIKNPVGIYLNKSGIEIIRTFSFPDDVKPLVNPDLENK